MAKRSGKIVTKDYLRSFGRDIRYFAGVEEWFDKINKIGADLGYEIEHYIISSGVKEIVEGSSIAKYFKRIYANFYAYNMNGEAYWPAQVVNYTSKTQYIYRVRKNVLDDLSSLDKINEKMNYLLEKMKVATIRPLLGTCTHKGDANLVGALANYIEEYIKLN